MGGVICFSCHTENIFVDRVGFRDTCVHCFSDLHVCKTCQFYDPKVYNECQEPSADRVKDKEKNNFCDFYQAKTSAKVSNSQKPPTREELRARAEALFSNSNKKDET